MDCPRCGSSVQVGQRFCANCGTRLEAVCTSCGASLPPGARFCPDCGTPVASATATAPSSASAAGEDTGGFSTAAASVAERRLVSVVFCDLVGFTTASESRDAEETRELLTAYYELCRERVERFGGAIEKFIGDAVVAVWGVPSAHEDDAERAVRAALDLVAAVPQLDATLAARASVMTGEAAVTLGAQGQGMVAGDLVNTASRLQAAADRGVVLVGEGTRAATERAIVYEPAGTTRLKGKDLPIEAWRAVRARAGIGGRLATDELEPPFVGRDAELRLLAEMYHATARERRLRLVSVTGQAGIGKSRLSREFESYLDGIRETVYWHRGRCPAYGEGLTFWAIGEMVRRRAGIAEADDPETTSERLRTMLAEFVPDPVDRSRIEPALRALLGLDTLGWVVSETGELYAAWRALFERIALKGPVVLVFEDLQWADDGLVGFIEHLLEWSRTQPILVVTLARPEFLETRPSWGAGLRNFISLHLEPLPDEAIVALLRGVVPGLPGPAAGAIARRAEGVPLYAVETIRMMINQGVLTADGTGYRLTGDVEHLAIPDSLRGLIAARIDSLPADSRALVHDAAVLGQSFRIAALSAVSGSSVGRIEPIIRELVRIELIRLESDPRSPERGQYVWVQSLIREVAYATLSKRDRRDRHIAAARYFQSLGDEEVAGILADHYLEAWRASGSGPEADALAGQARVALRAASERAERLRNWRQAASFVARALEVTPDPRDVPALLERSGDLLRRGGAWTEAERRYREALAALPEDADADSRARLAARTAQMIISELRLEEAEAYLHRSIATFGPDLTGPGRVMLEGQLGRANSLSNDPAGAVAVLERTIDAAERLGLTETLVEAIISLGTARSYQGRLLGLALLTGSIELARRLGFVNAEVRALNNVAVFAIETDPPYGREVMARLFKLSDRAGVDPLNWLVDEPREVAVTEGLDAGERLEAELRERVAPGSFQEVALLEQRLVLHALRGDAGGFDASRRILEASAPRTPEHQSAVRRDLAMGLLTLGRPDDAERVGADPSLPWTAGVRVLVALLRRDPAALAVAARALPGTTALEGPLARGLRAVAAAGGGLLAGADGPEVDSYLEGVGLLRGSLRPEYWTVSVVALVGLVGLGHAEVRDAVTDLRAEMERIGAWGPLALLDDAVAAATESTDASGRSEASGRAKASGRATHEHSATAVGDASVVR